MDYMEVDLENLNGGALPELFQAELEKALANIADVNTAAKEPREITLKVVLTPDESRASVKTKVQAWSKLAKPRPHESFLLLHFDGRRVKAFAADIKQQELSLMDNVIPMEGKK